MTAFVVIMTVAIVVMIGLVLDGGSVLAARREAIDEADGAARAAAQSVAPATRTSDRTVLDPARAQAAVDAYLAPTGHQGSVVVNGDSVAVTVSYSQHLEILGAAGLGSVTVTGHGAARAVRGVNNETVGP